MSAGAALLAALAGVELVPVTLVAGAVTVAVGVSIYAGEKVIEAAKRRSRCQKVKERCIETCSQTTLPTPDYGAKFFTCLRSCMEAAGC
jgi:hypothetical protein